MSLYLDSANVDTAIKSFDTGLVSGITTNPSLIAHELRPAEEIILELSRISNGIVFYQLMGSTVDERLIEAKHFVAISPGKIGLKIPCTFDNLKLAARLKSDGCLIGITAVFSAAQAYLAIQAGADFLLPYVNRSTRLQGDGLALVEEVRSVIEASGSNVEIIAASIKSPAEAVEAHLAGAHHLTLPFSLIESMGNHPLSDLAIDEFDRAIRDSR